LEPASPCFPTNVTIFHALYNHVNYACWGTIYLNEMHQLPQEVKKEFEAGNFVVKRSSLRFNQVEPDQSREWLGCIGKKGGGIIAVTKTTSALSRWALCFNLRSQLAHDTGVAISLVSCKSRCPYP